MQFTPLSHDTTAPIVWATWFQFETVALGHSLSHSLLTTIWIKAADCGPPNASWSFCLLQAPYFLQLHALWTILVQIDQLNSRKCPNLQMPFGLLGGTPWWWGASRQRTSIMSWRVCSWTMSLCLCVECHKTCMAWPNTRRTPTQPVAHWTFHDGTARANFIYRFALPKRTGLQSFSFVGGPKCPWKRVRRAFWQGADSYGTSYWGQISLLHVHSSLQLSCRHR